MIWDSFDPETLEFLARALDVAADTRLIDLYGTLAPGEDGNVFRDRCVEVAAAIRRSPRFPT